MSNAHNRISYCLLLFLLIFGYTPAYAGEHFSPATKMTFRQDTLTINTSGGERRFDIEIAETPRQWEYGLMFRRSLPHDHGMLFIMPKNTVITMWMKDTLIPLDMLFINAKGRIVRIAANARPESLTVISAGQPVRAAIELAGGAAKEFGIAVGDRVISPYFKP